jgi:hypothetical protein
MKLKISSIAALGTARKERLVLQVLASTDIGEFAVFRTRERAGTVTTGVLDVFWFPDKAVEAGDLVVLYSKRGRQSEKKLDNGSTVHFFYWGVEDPAWAQEGVAAVLLHVDEWRSHLPRESE